MCSQINAVMSSKKAARARKGAQAARLIGQGSLKRATLGCIPRLYLQIRVQQLQRRRLCERFGYFGCIPQLHPQIRVQQAQLRTLCERFGYQCCDLLRPGSGEMSVIRNAVRVVGACTRRQMHE